MDSILEYEQSEIDGIIGVIADAREVFKANAADLFDDAFIVLTSVVLFLPPYSPPEAFSESEKIKRYVAPFIIVLSWFEMITMIGRHPALGVEINVYILMMCKVLKSFLQSLCHLFLLHLRFSMGQKHHGFSRHYR